MDLNAGLVFVVAETLLCLAPGVAVPIVVSVGLTRGVHAAGVAGLGMSTIRQDDYGAFRSTGIASCPLSRAQRGGGTGWGPSVTRSDVDTVHRFDGGNGTRGCRHLVAMQLGSPRFARPPPHPSPALRAGEGARHR